MEPSTPSGRASAQKEEFLLLLGDRLAFFVSNLHSKTARKQKLVALYGSVCDHLGATSVGVLRNRVKWGRERTYLPPPLVSRTFRGSKKERTFEKRNFREHLQCVGSQLARKNVWLTWKCRMMVQMRPSVSFGLPVKGKWHWKQSWTQRFDVAFAEVDVSRTRLDTSYLRCLPLWCWPAWFSWTEGSRGPSGRSAACGSAFFPFLEAKMKK